jgi:membrane carboxypeptidase/penicillin-binding protein
VVLIGFDDDRALGEKKTGARTALPIFREVMFRIDEGQLVGPVPQFARAIDDGINQYLARQARAVREWGGREPPAPG